MVKEHEIGCDRPNASESRELLACEPAWKQFQNLLNLS
jgi:hypothetical protein